MTNEAEVCHEDIGTGPCGRPAVGHRIDPNHGEPYPVCWWHVRPVMAHEPVVMFHPEGRTTMTQITMTHEELLGLVYEAAGAATGPLMRDHPDYTFPSEEVATAVTRVIEEKTDIKVREVQGYAGVRS